MRSISKSASMVGSIRGKSRIGGEHRTAKGITCIGEPDTVAKNGVREVRVPIKRRIAKGCSTLKGGSAEHCASDDSGVNKQGEAVEGCPGEAGVVAMECGRCKSSAPDVRVTAVEVD